MTTKPAARLPSYERDRRYEHVEPLPDPVYFYRKHAAASMIDMMEDRYQAEACRARALGPHLEGLPADERAFGAYTCATTTNLAVARQTLAERERRLGARWRELESARRTLADRKRLLSAAQKELDTARRTVAERDRRIAATEQRLKGARRTVAEQDTRIAELAADLDAARRGHVRRRHRRGSQR